MTPRAAAGPSGSDRGETSDCLEDVVKQLRAALCSRDVIGQAKGVLMVLHGCTADEAFMMLRERSQHTNVKLRLVARAVVAERTGRRSPGAAIDPTLTDQEGCNDPRGPQARHRPA
jgi:hypothetical protein